MESNSSGLTHDEFDYEIISMEMRDAKSVARLQDIGRRIARETGLSEEVKAKLRSLYARLMEYLQRKGRR